jgi:hypothetical protein
LVSPGDSDNSLVFDEDLFRSNHAGRFLSAADEIKPKPTTVTTQNPGLESRYQSNQYEAGQLNQRAGGPRDSGHEGTALKNIAPVQRQGESNTSMLNQSLNSSIRMNRKTLEALTPDIARQLERKNTNQSGVLPKIQKNPLIEDNPEEDSVIEMNIDDEGYLLDQEGNYVLDDRGMPMKLTEEQIENLRENGLYDADD